MNSKNPRLSVIVPAYAGARVLPLSLSALVRSTLPREHWELIVVDDSSTDKTTLVAAQFADTVVRLAGKPHGPAYARNRGFEVSRGDIIVFIDADVCVHPTALAQFLEVMDANPDVSATFGSYDDAPAQPGIVSEFRNLLHHHVHQRDAGEAETFWAGCGAIRARAFRQVGMFDEWHYARPQIEDIELGRRLRLAGHRILLRPEIQGTHLKRWTLRETLKTDFQHRGVPWTRLLLQEGPNQSGQILNLRQAEKVCTVAAGVAAVGLITAALSVGFEPLFATAAAVLTITVLNRDLYRFIARARGPVFVLRILPFHLLFYMMNIVSAASGWVLHILLGEPAAPVEVAAAAGMEFDVWPPRASRPRGGVWDPPPSQTDTRPDSAAAPMKPTALRAS